MGTAQKRDNIKKNILGLISNKAFPMMGNDNSLRFG
jgi:hypothetical protein